MDIEQLEELSFLAKTKEQQDNLMQRYLAEKRRLENTEFYKEMEKNRKKYTHYVFVTQRGVSNK